VLVDGVRIQLLMYADDIVLIAENEADLQCMLDAVSRYAEQWRFTFNTDRKKSEVVVFGAAAPPSSCQLMLQKNELTVSSEYRYLGLEMQSNGRWTLVRATRYAKANSALACMYSCLSQTTQLSVRDALQVWKQGVVSTLHFGCEVWQSGPWPQAERCCIALRAACCK